MAKLQNWAPVNVHDIIVDTKDAINDIVDNVQQATGADAPQDVTNAIVFGRNNITSINLKAAFAAVLVSGSWQLNRWGWVFNLPTTSVAIQNFRIVRKQISKGIKFKDTDFVRFSS